MVGLGVRLYIDEHVPKRLAKALRDRGYDAESCREVGRDNRRLSDEVQLEYAAQQARAILTFDIGDYQRLEGEWKATGRHHAGIIVCRQITDVGELLRRAQLHLDTFGPDVQHDTLLWLA